MQNNPELAALGKSVRQARVLVASLAATLIAAYVVWFGLLHETTLSTTPESWGQFGDYVGGILNPIVAFFAFYWLTQSIRIQKEELAETRAALEESAEYQAEQAEHSRMSAYLSALTSNLVWLQDEINSKRSEALFVFEQIAKGNATVYGYDGASMDRDAALAHVSRLHEETIIRTSHRAMLEGDSVSIVNAFRELDGKQLNYRYRRKGRTSEA